MLSFCANLPALRAFLGRGLALGSRRGAGSEADARPGARRRAAGVRHGAGAELHGGHCRGRRLPGVGMVPPTPRNPRGFNTISKRERACMTRRGFHFRKTVFRVLRFSRS